MRKCGCVPGGARGSLQNVDEGDPCWMLMGLSVSGQKSDETEFRQKMTPCLGFGRLSSLPAPTWAARLIWRSRPRPPDGAGTSRSDTTAKSAL